MSKDKTTQSQQEVPEGRSPFGVFTMPQWTNPFATEQWQKLAQTNPFATEQWQKLAQDSFARAEAVAEQMNKLETAGFERAKAGLDDMHKLFHDSMDYVTRMTAEWRTLTLDGLRNLAPEQDVEAENSKAKKAA